MDIPRVTEKRTSDVAPTLPPKNLNTTRPVNTTGTCPPKYYPPPPTPGGSPESLSRKLLELTAPAPATISIS